MVAEFLAKTRQYGRIRIPDKLIVESPYMLAEMFSQLKLVPVRLEYHLEARYMDYIALSPYFTNVPEGCEAPEYLIAEAQTEDGAITYSVLRR